MTKYHTILIPTDGSPPSERGIEHGLGIAEDNGSTVHFLHVLDSRLGDTPALSSFELALEEAENEALDDLEALADRARGRGIDAEICCTRGDPYREVVEYADEINADLIVMGKHGQGAAESPHIGSVADRVLRTAKQPVFTV